MKKARGMGRGALGKKKKRGRGKAGMRGCGDAELEMRSCANFWQLGRCAAVRQRGGGGAVLGGEPPGSAADVGGDLGEQRGRGVGDDNAAD